MWPDLLSVALMLPAALVGFAAGRLSARDDQSPRRTTVAPVSERVEYRACYRAPDGAVGAFEEVRDTRRPDPTVIGSARPVSPSRSLGPGRAGLTDWS